MICIVCRVGMSGTSAPASDVPAYYTCTWSCLKEFMNGEKVFTNPLPYETEGLSAASEKGGAYIDALRKPNFAAWSADEWETFIKVVVNAFQNQVRDSMFSDTKSS